jgi:hypothetical protein
LFVVEELLPPHPCKISVKLQVRSVSFFMKYPSFVRTE